MTIRQGDQRSTFSAKSFLPQREGRGVEREWAMGVGFGYADQRMWASRGHGHGWTWTGTYIYRMQH